jgi:hypothetical protein
MTRINWRLAPNWRWCLRLLRQHLCKHDCLIESIRRINADQVQCPCHKCGRVLSAPCGLALKATLRRAGGA